MGYRLVNIGFGNIVSADRLIAIVSPESAPIKRIVQEARETGRLIDATCGRRTRAVVITDSDHIILSAIQPETVANPRASAREQSTVSCSNVTAISNYLFPQRRGNRAPAKSTAYTISSSMRTDSSL